MEDLYKVLKCEENASSEDLKRSYQKLVLECHPDKLQNQNLTQVEIEQATNEFIRIDKAWKILSDDNLRQKYDARWKERCIAQTWPIQEEVEICDFDVDEDGLHQYPCRCGGEFSLDQTDVTLCMDIVTCSNCSLAIKVRYPKE